MKIHPPHTAVAALLGLLPISGYILAENAAPPAPVVTSNSVSADDLAAASERIRQTSMQIRAGIQEAREARIRRAAQEARLEAERKKAERARAQARDEVAQSAALKEEKQRHALEAAQAQARREAAEREQKTTREHQAALAAQRASEEAAARTLEARERAAIELKKARAASGPKFAEDL